MIIPSLSGLARTAVAASLVGLLSMPGVASAETIASWTFEAPNVPTDSTGQSSGPWSPTTGSGSASGFHTSTSTGWSSPSGNGSADSFSSNNWAIGDYYQFQAATTGLTGIGISFDQNRSGTGPSGFDLQYRAGSSGGFTTFGSYVVPNESWSPTTPVSGSTSFSYDMSSVSSLNGQADIFFRLTATSAPSASAGTNRVDNVQITGVPEPSTVVLGAAGLCLAGITARRRLRRA